MAKRWRDEVATRATALKHRNRSGVAEESEPERRRRIAGERPGSKPAEGGPVERDEQGTDRSAAKVSDDGADEQFSGAQSPAQRIAAGMPTGSRFVAATTAAGTGIVVGGVLTGLVYAGMRTFEAIYNTPAGGAAGAVVLLLVLTVAAVVGRYLLRWRGLPDPNATSLLAIMLIVIVTLAALLPIVFSSWMLLITPVLGGASYLVAHLLIAHFGDHS